MTENLKSRNSSQGQVDVGTVGKLNYRTVETLGFWQ